MPDQLQAVPRSSLYKYINRLCIVNALRYPQEEPKSTRHHSTPAIIQFHPSPEQTKKKLNTFIYQYNTYLLGVRARYR